jgi:hypothetical protein
MALHQGLPAVSAEARAGCAPALPCLSSGLKLILLTVRFSRPAPGPIGGSILLPASSRTFRKMPRAGGGGERMFVLGATVNLRGVCKGAEGQVGAPCETCFAPALPRLASQPSACHTQIIMHGCIVESDVGRAQVTGGLRPASPAAWATPRTATRLSLHLLPQGHGRMDLRHNLTLRLSSASFWDGCVGMLPAHSLRTHALTALSDTPELLACMCVT